MIIPYFWPRWGGGGMSAVAHRAAFWLHALAVDFWSVATAPSSRGQNFYSARDGEATLVGSSGQGDLVLVLATWNGPPARRLGEASCVGFDRTRVTSVILSENLRAIQASAFENWLRLRDAAPFADPEAATSPSRVYRFRVQ